MVEAQWENLMEENMMEEVILVTLLIRVKANDCPDLNHNDGPACHPENHLQKGKILMES